MFTELDSIEIFLIAILLCSFAISFGSSVWYFIKRNDEKQLAKLKFNPKKFHLSHVMICYALFMLGCSGQILWMTWSTIWGTDEYELFGFSMPSYYIMIGLMYVLFILFGVLLFFWARKSKEEREDEEEKKGRE